MLLVKPQIHPSHLDTFLLCCYLYSLVYIEGQRRPPGVAAHIGRGTHEGIEANLIHKLNEGDLLPLEAVQEITRDATNAAWEKDGALLSEDDKEKGVPRVKGEAIDMAISLGTTHYSQLAPRIQPEHIERPWVLECKGFPFDMAGRFDLQEKPIIGKVGFLVDTKTSGKSEKQLQADADGRDQLSIYALAVKKLDGEFPEVRIDYLLKKGNKRAISIITPRPVQRIKATMRCLEVMADALIKEVFPPTGKGSWKCSPQYCGFYPCKYVG
jgi:hypothetical protein